MLATMCAKLVSFGLEHFDPSNCELLRAKLLLLPRAASEAGGGTTLPTGHVAKHFVN